MGFGIKEGQSLHVSRPTGPPGVQAQLCHGNPHFAEEGWGTPPAFWGVEKGPRCPQSDEKRGILSVR